MILGTTSKITHHVKKLTECKVLLPEYKNNLIKI